MWSPEALMELLLPRTDAGVVAQLVAFGTGATLTLWLIRRRRDLLIFVSGLTLFALALMGLRALH